MPKNTTVLSPVENFALSGAAAVISKTVAAPIERVMLMIQNQDEMIKQGALKERYKGPGDCFRRVVAEEGVPSLWRGNAANCLRYFPTQALNFMFKERIKQVFKKNKGDATAVKLGKNVAAGGCAGTLSLCFVYSLDYARTRLANDVKSVKKGAAAGAEATRQYSGLFDVYKQTLKSDGIGGLYRGFVISAVGIFVYRGLYFGMYDTVRPMFPTNTGVFTSFLLGYAVTVSAGIMSYPIDTIRRRMMMTSGQAVKYSGSLDAARHILVNEGVTSFFKGAGANVLRGMAGAGTLAGFDEFKKYYTNYMYPID